jgi:anti-sigma factor RsiW
MSAPKAPMEPTQLQPLSEEEMHAFVDGQLGSTERPTLQQRLALDPVAQTKVHAWQQQRDALRGLHHAALDEPLPPSLLSAAHSTDMRQGAMRTWSRWGGMAASVLLAFGLGWLSHWQLGGLRTPESQSLAKSGNVNEFVRQAALAHSVYTPEQRHPVEVTAAQQEHLVQWLSKRLGKSLKVPNLDAAGFGLVGGRLLPGDEGARAQFMFQNTAGERVTLYLGSVQSNTSRLDRLETAFRFSSERGVPGFYWVDQGFGYALSGTLDHDKLLKLAELVYQQL